MNRGRCQLSNECQPVKYKYQQLQPDFRPTVALLVISVTVNGEHRQFERPLNCAELLARLELAGRRVALERNGEIVPRSRFPEQMLADGDRLEIVVAVGGG